MNIDFSIKSGGIDMALHRFEPTRFYTTLGSHEPALRVASGDTIETWTLDCRGIDSQMRELSTGPNPQTGPFFLEGAEPGDTLAVRFEHLAPNRRVGHTNTILIPGTLDPSYVAASVFGREEIEWEIDTEAWTASTRAPFLKGTRISLPLDPMVGCFGVAPPGAQSIAASTSGRHGGNMDYRGFRQGVTVYFPVFVQGGLFTLGDGHAIQGDGEVVGTGIETSFDVRFTLSLSKGKSIGNPRAEDDEYLMTVGNARPLVQALQHATTGMVLWLRELGLAGNTPDIVLGQCVEYDIANVIDPAFTVVCKMKKSILQGLGVETSRVMED